MDDFDPQRIGERLAALRRHRGLTLGRAAAAVTAAGYPVSGEALRGWERGLRTRPNPAFGRAVAHAYGWPSLEALMASDALDPAGANADTPVVSLHESPPRAG